MLNSSSTQGNFNFDLVQDVQHVITNTKVGLRHVRDLVVGPRVEERIDNLEAKVEDFSPEMVQKLESIRDAYQGQSDLHANLNQYENTLASVGKTGNKLKPGWLKQVDDVIVDLFSRGFNIEIPSNADVGTYYKILGELKKAVDEGNYTNAEALKKLAELEDHVVQRKEKAVKDHLDSLEQITEMGVKIDRKMDLQIVAKDEDYLAAMNDALAQYQSAYSAHLNKTEALVGPIDPRPNDGISHLVDGAVTYGPFAAAAVGYVALHYGLKHVPIIGKKIRKGVNKLLCLPVTIPATMFAHGLDFTVNHVKPKVKKVVSNIKNKPKGGKKK